MAGWIVLPVVAAALVAVYFWMTAGKRMNGEGRWLLEYAYAHRGLHNESWPENTLPAFENAIKNGFGIELDVHLSRDGHVVVFHDHTLGRLTGAAGKVEEKTLEELQALRIAGSEYTIPTMRQVLDLVAGRTPLLIETKNEGGAGELEVKLEELMRGYAGRYAVQSFSPFSIGWYRKHAPQVLRGQLSTDFKEGADHIAPVKRFMVRYLLTNFLCRPNFISYDERVISTGIVQRLRRTGVPALAWTVRSSQREETVRGCADGVIFEGYNNTPAE